MSKKVSLVTGGAGFIGSHVADHLLKMGHKVIVLDDLSGGFEYNVNKKAIFYKGSTTDEKILNEVFKKYKFSYVYHLAAYAAEGLSHFIRKFNYTNNLLSSIHLINRAVLHNVEHFVFTSSIAVYGPNQTPMRENLTPMPEDPYGIAKYAVELDLQAAHRMFGLNYTIFRPHNVYGERQNHGDPYRNVLGIFINNIMQGKPMTIFGDGTQTRSLCYVDDTIEGIVRLMNYPHTKGEIVNIGSQDEHTVREYAQIIKKLTHSSSEIICAESLPDTDPKVRRADTTKAKKLLQWQPQIHLEAGLQKMIDWVRSTL
jgi:UDP-glucose 4-epimerase